MARTVDPVRHEARRLAIIDAALTCFAADGFDRTTTATICRTAGIGSGTFFHYFPTKLGVLLAIIELGTSDTAAWFEASGDAPSPSASCWTSSHVPRTRGPILASPASSGPLARSCPTRSRRGARAGRGRPPRGTAALGRGIPARRRDPQRPPARSAHRLDHGPARRLPRPDLRRAVRPSGRARHVLDTARRLIAP